MTDAGRWQFALDTAPPYRIFPRSNQEPLRFPRTCGSQLNAGDALARPIGPERWTILVQNGTGNHP